MLISRAPRWVGPAAAAGGLLIAATAYAAIPGDGNVYRACMLKNVGTVRLIDPGLPSGNLMSHCTSLETQVSWNQSGQPGPPGPQGPPGDVTGTLTSPNGAYSISVTDAGIVLRAPGASARLAGSDIVLDSSSSTTVHAGTGLDLASDGATTLRTAKRFVASSGTDTSFAVGKDLSVAVDGSTTVQGARDVTVQSGGDTTLRSAAGVLLSSAGPVTVNGTPIP